MQEEIINFIQTNSPDGGFLQSEEWRKFQESFGRKTFHIEGENYWSNVIEHALPIVGKYCYIPRGPIIPAQAVIQSKILDSGSPAAPSLGGEAGMATMINLAKKENAGWIRFDANNSHILEIVREHSRAVTEAPHDMQPRELFIVDLNKSEDELLAGMKSKTRYNIRLAQKHGVKAFVAVIPEQAGIQPKGVDSGSPAGTTNEYLEEFLRLVKITAQRDKITPHPDGYYRKMFETIPAENIKLYIAEYDGPASTRPPRLGEAGGDSSSTRGGKIVAANINIFFGKTATYMHGASDHNYKNVMAPYLLQWQAMLHAKAAGCEKYDLGGVKTHNADRIAHNVNRKEHNEKGDTRYAIRDTSSWSGITKFKTGFSANTEPTKFPGSYDIVLNPFRYNLYRILQRIKALFKVRI